MPFTLTSSEFSEGGEIPVEFSCDGEDQPPPLSWSGVPEGTAELALLMDDPDARGFVHWLVTGIPAGASSLGAGNLPAEAVEGRNDFGRSGYGGPCPPSGTHRYVVTVYALSESLSLSGTPTADEFRNASNGKVLGEARLEARYTRQR